MNNLKIAKTKDVKTPQRGSSKSAGLDFFIPSDWNGGCPFAIKPQQQILIDSGIHIDMIGSGLEHYMFMFADKSGIATKKQLIVGAKVCDADYEGSIHINLHNIGSESVIVSPGDKIIQGILIPVSYADVEINDLEDLYKIKSERGAGGFGSTGDK